MLGITDFWTYVLGVVAIVLLPGPNSIFVLSVSAQRGIQAGYQAAFGVFLGDAVLMLLSATGVASLLSAYPPLFLVLKYAGAAYLSWVGVNIIRRAWSRRRRRSEPAPVTADEPPQGMQRPFRRAAVISLMNPKAILFFISFFIQFVQPGYPYPELSFLVLGAVVQFFSALYLSALIFGGRYLAGQFRQRRGLAAGAATAVGALFVGFGIKLATASVG